MYVKVRAAGLRPRNLSLKVKSSSGRSEIDHARAVVVQDLAAGRLHDAESGKDFAAFVAEYTAHYLSKAGPARRLSRESSWRTDSCQLRSVVQFLESRKRRFIHEAATDDVEAYRDSRASASLETVKKAIRVAKAAWNWAIRKKWATENPFVGVHFPKAHKKDPRNLSLPEVRKVLAAEAEPLVTVAIVLALYAGLRAGEIGRLEWPHLVWGKRGYIRLGPGKDGEPRSTVFPMELQAILRPYKAASGRVCPETYSWLEKRVAVVSARSGVDFSLHDLRRTCARFMRDRGVPPHRIQAYLGHSSIATTEGYYLGKHRGVEAADAEALAFGGSRNGSMSGHGNTRKRG